MNTAVASHITGVVVHPDGATVTRTGRLSEGAGRRTVEIAVPWQVEPDSVTAALSTGTRLVSLDFEVDRSRPAGSGARRKDLVSRLDEARTAVTRLDDAVAVLEARERFVVANCRLGGRTDAGVDLLSQLDGYLADQLATVRDTMSQLRRDRVEAERHRERIEKALAHLGDERPDPVGRVVVECESAEPDAPEITVGYFTRQARWRPQHELRVDDLAGPVRLAFTARVTQDTGEDWSDVPLVVSTARPGLGGTAPELDPWRLRMPRPVAVMCAQASPAPFDTQDMAVAGKQVMAPAQSAPRAPAASEPVMVSGDAGEATANASQWTITTPCRLESGKGERVFDVLEMEIAAQYRHVAIPKLDPDAFLQARLDGWSQLDLPPGPAKVFLENRYVGTTFVDTGTTDDELDVALGRDAAIFVTREKSDELARHRLGRKSRATRGWKIAVRNNKPTTVELVLHDQIPLSADADITVTPRELSGGELDTTTGEVTWTLVIDPGAVEERTIAFDVDHPKGTYLSL
ncbi:MAG: DUF4139 domain-containing protein [Micrococcales bacterium]|nr:DUF4139 domain-containing protein [Micrococcales bacterium]MCL2667773.1 DUF4139 domain-containing protein [Micrococcales bacterium]